MNVTVNIADFQPWGQAPSTQPGKRRLGKRNAFDTQARPDRFDAEAAGEIAQPAPVVDISAAYRPIAHRALHVYSVRRRAKVLHFTGSSAVREAMRSGEGVLRSEGMGEDGRDLPPAA